MGASEPGAGGGGRIRPADRRPRRAQMAHTPQIEQLGVVRRSARAARSSRRIRRPRRRRKAPRHGRGRASPSGSSRMPDRGGADARQRGGDSSIADADPQQPRRSRIMSPPSAAAAAMLTAGGAARSRGPSAVADAAAADVTPKLVVQLLEGQAGGGAEGVGRIGSRRNGREAVSAVPPAAPACCRNSGSAASSAA